jgi:Na+-transporting methylmalonyl-CoA/oxaloacetate decarboxylase beta subunit
MQTFTIDATTGYTPKSTRVSNKIGKTEDHSSMIRFATFAMAATTCGYIAFKVFSVIGVM